MAGPAGHPGGGRRWLSLAALCTAAGLVWLAFADLGVAVPTIANDLGGELSALSWANNAFALVTGAPGLSDAQIDKLQAALVNSDAAKEVLNSVSPDQRAQLLEAGKDVVADATAGAMWVTAVLGLVATVIVVFLWPRRERG